MLKLLSLLLSFYSFISHASSAINLKSSKQVRFAEYTDDLVNGVSVPHYKKANQDNAENACKCLRPSAILSKKGQDPVEAIKAFLGKIGQDPVEAVKTLLDNIDGKWRRFLFLYYVSEKLEDDKAYFFMKHCSKDYAELSPLVSEHAAALIYNEVMCEELEKMKDVLEKEPLELIQRFETKTKTTACKIFKEYFRRLQKSLDDWKSPVLRDQIFSEVKELTNLGASVRPNITLPELLKSMESHLKEKINDQEQRTAIQLLATFMYTLDNPNLTHDEIIAMWIKAFTPNTKSHKNAEKNMKMVKKGAKKALKQMPYIRQVLNELIHNPKVSLKGIIEGVSTLKSEKNLKGKRCYELLFEYLSSAIQKSRGEKPVNIHDAY